MKEKMSNLEASISSAQYDVVSQKLLNITRGLHVLEGSYQEQSVTVTAHEIASMT